MAIAGATGSRVASRVNEKTSAAASFATGLRRASGASGAATGSMLIIGGRPVRGAG